MPVSHDSGVKRGIDIYLLRGKAGFTARTAEYKADYHGPMGTQIFLGIRPDNAA